MTSQTQTSLLSLLPETSQAFAGIAVSGLTLDSRKVQAGTLFFARVGSKQNGVEYIKDAFKAGAVAVVAGRGTVSDELKAAVSGPIIEVEDLDRTVGEMASRFYGQPSRKMEVVGITGTNGKTSSAHFLAQALIRCGLKAAVIGTTGNGFPGQLRPATQTTPDPISLQAELARLHDEGAQAVVMEVSSHALDQQRVAGIRFVAAAYTNLTRDHLDYHGSMEAYAAAKARLFTDYHVPLQVLNMDEPYPAALLAQAVPEGVERISYGLDPRATVSASRINLSNQGMMFELRSRWGEQFVSSSLLGQFNVSNLLLVAAVLSGMGYELNQIVSALALLKPVPGRMELVGRHPTVIVDYAHTPDALEKALLSMRQHVQEGARLWVVCGCGGDRDRGKRAPMGRLAADLADCAVLTSDNPRTEDPQAILDEMSVDLPEGSAEVIVDRADAIRQAVLCADINDVILIAGKGHETYQEINGERHHFSDQEVAREALAQRKEAVC